MKRKIGLFLVLMIAVLLLGAACGKSAKPDVQETATPAQTAMELRPVQISGTVTGNFITIHVGSDLNETDFEKLAALFDEGDCRLTGIWMARTGSKGEVITEQIPVAGGETNRQFWEKAESFLQNPKQKEARFEKITLYASSAVTARVEQLVDKS